MSEALDTAPIENGIPEQVEQEDVVNNATEVEEQKQVEEDYSWVPAKYMRDGKPDFKEIEKARSNLEKKLSTKGAFAPDDITEYETEGLLNLYGQEIIDEEFLVKAKEAGISKDQLKFVASQINEVVNAFGLVPEKASEQLKNEWGSNFDANLGLARRAFEEFAPSDLNINDPIFNNPSVLKLLVAAGRELGEDRSSPVKGKSGTAIMSEEEVIAIQKSPEYLNSRELQAKVSAWYERNYR